jgi:hypothetical protein
MKRDMCIKTLGTISTAQLMKNGVFWYVTPCSSCKNRRFGGTSVLTRATRRNSPEDAILHSHRRENLKFHILHDSLLSVCVYMYIPLSLLGNSFVGTLQRQRIHNNIRRNIGGVVFYASFFIKERLSNTGIIWKADWHVSYHSSCSY